LKIFTNSGEDCAKDERYSVTLMLHCQPKPADDTTDQPIYIVDEDSLKNFSTKKCHNTLKIKTSESCAKVDYYHISAFAYRNRIPVGLILIFIGLILMAAGIRFIKVLIFIYGVVMAVTIALLIYSLIIQFVGDIPLWIILACSVVIGLGLGYCLIKMSKIFIICLGGYLGYLLFVFLFNLVLKHIHIWGAIVYFIVAVVFIIASAYVSLKISKIVIYLATSIIGAYIFIKGFTLIIGGYVSESIVNDLMNFAEYDLLKTVLIFLFRLLLGLFMFILSCGFYVVLLRYLCNLKRLHRNTIHNLMKL
jgi:hypothetical protein